MSNEVLSAIKDYLSTHIQLALATNGDHPWIATMYYGMDDDLNIYFLTSPETIHAKGLKQNSLVSAVIADSPQKPDSKKIGIQLYGHASEIEGEEAIKSALKIWCGVLKVTDPKYSYEGIKSGDLHYRIYKLVPKKIKYYNEALWDEGDEKVIQF
ncbi:pyridoxamine 5'-phosphate oxidase family protein [Candidatus Woesebacteria bacterium]|nr:pyridoxamine 5'-phosphate oxidase family protein [Candidatus Woesebacteria bacterium]